MAYWLSREDGFMRMPGGIGTFGGAFLEIMTLSTPLHSKALGYL